MSRLCATHESSVQRSASSPGLQPVKENKQQQKMAENRGGGGNFKYLLNISNGVKINDIPVQSSAQSSVNIIVVCYV